MSRPSVWWDGLAPHLPALAIGLLWFGVASWIAVAEHATYNTTSRDLGVYLQVLWNTGHGRPYATTLLEANRLHLAEHVAPLLALLAPAYAAVPHAGWLMVLQQAALALSAVPVYVLARRLLGGIWLPTVVVAGFFATPTLVEVALDAFYPIAFAALPLSVAAYWLLMGRLRAGVACALLALPIEEEAALTVLGLGAFCWLRLRRRRVSLFLMGSALVWLAALAVVATPRFHEPSTVSATDNRTVGHFGDLLRDPSGAIGTLVQRVPRAARWLLLPTGGLALLAPETLLIDLPHAATLLLADNEGRYRRHWAAPLLPAIWLATVVGLSRLHGARRTIGVVLLLVGGTTTYVLDSSLPGGGGHEPQDVVWSDRAEQLDHLVARVPPGAPVGASRRALARLAARPEVYVFPPSYGGRLWPPERRLEAYVLDLTNEGTREALGGRQSPLRATRPYAIWLAGPDAMLLTDRPPSPTVPVDQEVGPFRLLGYDLHRQGTADVHVTLHWRADGRPGRPLAREARLWDDAGTLVDRSSGTALDGIFSSSEWPSGQVFLDRVRLTSGDGRPMRLEVGWVDRSGAFDGLDLLLGGAQP